MDRSYWLTLLACAAERNRPTEVRTMLDPVSLTILGNIFRGAAVLLLIVVFVPAVIASWLLQRHHD
jgi:F0F1-type ATP synthase membrane subunit a